MLPQEELRGAPSLVSGSYVITAPYFNRQDAKCAKEDLLLCGETAKQKLAFMDSMKYTRRQRAPVSSVSAACWKSPSQAGRFKNFKDQMGKHSSLLGEAFLFGVHPPKRKIFLAALASWRFVIPLCSAACRTAEREADAERP
jgi:hypothetical protein